MKMIKQMIEKLKEMIMQLNMKMIKQMIEKLNEIVDQKLVSPRQLAYIDSL